MTDERKRGWIGVDFDGTLATYYGWGDPRNGEPIPAMVARIKQWLAQGIEVRILTARVAIPFVDASLEIFARAINNVREQRGIVDEFCVKYIGQKLPITNEKDYEMIELWDDRAVRVRRNEGITCCAHAREDADGHRARHGLQ